MAHEPLPGEQPGKIEALLQRWQTSLDLHARYAALDDARYWHVQPWPRHERPQRWIIQLARKRILALKRIVTQRIHEGDAAFVEGIETMAFLATLVGLTSVERFIPLATHETERGEVLQASPEESEIPAAPPRTRTGEHRRTAETTRQMPVLPNTKAVPPRAPAPVPAPVRREPRREAQRPAGVKPKKAAGITQAEHVVIADAVRLLEWGKQWHEIADMIARLAERPSPSEIRRVLRTYREHIDAVVKRRRD
jgi:hypothetical protein